MFFFFQSVKELNKLLLQTHSTGDDTKFMPTDIRCNEGDFSVKINYNKEMATFPTGN